MTGPRLKRPRYNEVVLLSVLYTLQTHIYVRTLQYCSHHAYYAYLRLLYCTECRTALCSMSQLYVN